MILSATTFGLGPDIVLLHGWLANNSLWQDWAKTTFERHRVTLIELPGHGASPYLLINDETDLLTTWQDAVLAVMPEKAILLGWSLGGLIAQSIALNYPERVSKLILLASSPCFVQGTRWIHGLSPEHFARYVTDIRNDPEGLFKSFLMLQSLGSSKPKQSFKQLSQKLLPVTADHHALEQGLTLLGAVDLRQRLSDIEIPTQWILSEHDAIVPISLAEQLKHLQPNAIVRVIPNCGHLPFLTSPEVIPLD